MNGPEEREQRKEMKELYEGEVAPTEFEQALARAMQRVDVRAETTKKFLALAEEAEKQRVAKGGGLRLVSFSGGGRVVAMPRPQAWMGGAIAAVLAIGCFVGAHIHTEHERKVQADRQFEAAERITDETLARTREELQQRGIQLEP
jgi:hypothetical protein